nr:MAG TPA: hypothetical protein [Caudoviricetes sp.]
MSIYFPLDNTAIVSSPETNHVLVITLVRGIPVSAKWSGTEYPLLWQGRALHWTIRRITGYTSSTIRRKWLRATSSRVLPS